MPLRQAAFADGIVSDEPCSAFYLTLLRVAAELARRYDGRVRLFSNSSLAPIDRSLMASIMPAPWLACQTYAVLRIEGMANWLTRPVANAAADVWRRFAAAIVFSMVLLGLLASSARAEETSEAIALPKTGAAPAGMESYDRLIAELMAKWKIPGGQIGVVKDGSLVLSRGYGWADVEL